MPTKKQSETKTKTEAPKEEAVAKAVVSRIGEYEDNPIPAKQGEVKTRNGNTITYN